MPPKTGDLFARRYRLGPELGRGAMGIVFEARHEALGHAVAIKVLAASLDAPSVRRFEREARIAAALDSPHVVKVLDVDRAEDGTPFLVMERLEGRDLAAEVALRAGPVPPEEAVAWMLQVCEAMALAHAGGIVHRDLKLSNLLLTPQGIVKVLDFGVASLRVDGEDGSTQGAVGTPRYMSPEQLLGESARPASDVWAIGVMLYRLLSGRFPYDAPTTAAQMLAILEGCAPLAVAAPGSAYRGVASGESPAVPEALGRVVDRALARTLEERTASVEELAEGLRGALARGGATERPRPDTGRRRWALPALAACAALAVAWAVGASSEPWARPRRGVVEGTAAARASSTARALVEAASPPIVPEVDAGRPLPPRGRFAPVAGSAAASIAPRVEPASSVGDGFPAHL